MKSSQKQNILRHLLYGPLCGQEQDWSLGRRIPARIHELRGKGFPIEKRTCDQGHTHLTHQWEFYIDRPLIGVSPHAVMFEDWCADCGLDGTLRPVDDAGTGWMHNNRYWLQYACSECGKGDWR